MIRRIEIHPIPTAGEKHLCAQAVRTVRYRKIRRLRGGRSIIIQTGVRNSLAGEVGRGGAFEGVACDHPQAGGEGGEVGGFVGAGALEVVDSCAAGLGDGGEAAVGVFVVEGWGPVVGEVADDGAGGAGGGLGGGVGHVEGEGVAAHDGVDVAGGDAGADDGVGAFDDEGGDAGKTPECG